MSEAGTLDRFEGMERRLAELDAQLQDPRIVERQAEYVALMRERGSLHKVVDLYRDYRRAYGQEQEAREILTVGDDQELAALAREELPELERRRQEAYDRLLGHFVRDDPEGDRDCILEIRAGTGGDEAALFARDLFDAYRRYAEKQGWKIEILDTGETELGGFKEVTFGIKGAGAFRQFRFESGGHRVQRVPTTETQGRIHTSAVTVAVLPEIEELQIEIRSEDLKVDTYRSSGPGGQHVNKTESAIRITHIPTGTVVACQQEKSQHKNRAQAMRMLRSRIYEAERARRAQERGELRRSLIGTGDRSERIRTYNFPQNRVTDHRIGFSVYDLEGVMLGKLEAIVEKLLDFDREEQLKQLVG